MHGHPKAASPNKKHWPHCMDIPKQPKPWPRYMVIPKQSQLATLHGHPKTITAGYTPWSSQSNHSWLHSMVIPKQPQLATHQGHPKDGTSQSSYSGPHSTAIPKKRPRRLAALRAMAADTIRSGARWVTGGTSRRGWGVWEMDVRQGPNMGEASIWRGGAAVCVTG